MILKPVVSKVSLTGYGWVGVGRTGGGVRRVRRVVRVRRVQLRVLPPFDRLVLRHAARQQQPAVARRRHVVVCRRRHVVVLRGVSVRMSVPGR